MTEKVQLTGGPEKSTTWIWLENGKLKVEYHDFNEPAQKLFGNDIAWMITVNQSETTLIAWMQQYFKSYFGIKQWLEKHEIDFSIERESWA